MQSQTMLCCNGGCAPISCLPTLGIRRQQTLARGHGPKRMFSGYSTPVVSESSKQGRIKVCHFSPTMQKSVV